LIGNIPYYITAPILFHILDNKTQLTKAVLTIQREVSKRIFAAPATKDYSRLTLAVRFSAEAKHAFDISRNCFTPKPEVDSSTLTLSFSGGDAPDPSEAEAFFYLTRTAFAQRRKTLLHLFLQDKQLKKAGREQWLKWLKELGVQEKARGEELLLKDYLFLAREVRQHNLM